jgi:hypothetical protein
MLQKISPRCLRRLITEIQTDECTAERYSQREGQDMHETRNKIPEIESLSQVSVIQ